MPVSLVPSTGPEEESGVVPASTQNIYSDTDCRHPGPVLVGWTTGLAKGPGRVVGSAAMRLCSSFAFQLIAAALSQIAMK